MGRVRGEDLFLWRLCLSQIFPLLTLLPEAAEQARGTCVCVFMAEPYLHLVIVVFPCCFAYRKSRSVFFFFCMLLLVV